jgi:hypothetical protein
VIIIYPIGIPLLFLFLVWKHRAVLSDEEAVAKEAEEGNPGTGHILFLTSNCK